MDAARKASHSGSITELQSTVDSPDFCAVDVEDAFPSFHFAGTVNGNPVQSKHGICVRIDDSTLHFQCQLHYEEKIWTLTSVATEIGDFVFDVAEDNPFDALDREQGVTPLDHTYHEVRCRQYEFRFYLQTVLDDGENFVLQSALVRPETSIDGIDYVIQNLDVTVSPSMTNLSLDGVRVCGEMWWFEEPQNVEGMVSFALEHKDYMRHLEPRKAEIVRGDSCWRVQTTYVLTTGETYGLTFDIPSMQTHEWQPDDLRLTLTHTKVSVQNALIPVSINSYAGWRVFGTAYNWSREDFEMYFEGRICDDERGVKRIVGLFCAKLFPW